MEPALSETNHQETPPAQKAELNFSAKQLRRLMIPLLIEQFLTYTVGLADSLMVARVGEAAVSAVSLVDTVNVLLIGALNALAAGGAVVAGQYIGQQRLKKANSAAEQLLLFMILLSALLTGLLYAFRTGLLRILFGHIDPVVMGHCQTYFLIVEASIPFMAVYSAGAALFRIMGNSAISMKTSLLMNGINVAGNALLIFGFRMGVAGVAIPTLVSRMAAAVIVVILLFRQNQPIHFNRPFRPRFEKRIITNILRLGVPSGVESSLFQLGKVILLSVVSAFGTASIAANAIGNTVASFQILAPQAIGIGMMTIVSQCVGSGDFSKTRLYIKKLMKASYLATLVTNLLIFALLPLLLRLYNVSAEASALAFKILLLHGGLAILLWSPAFVLPQALKAAGDTTFTMIAAVVSMWCFRIVFGIWFAKYLSQGVLGIWLAMYIDWICRTAVYLLRYRGRRWESKLLKE